VKPRLGMTPEQYGDFKAGLFAALEADGISPNQVDVRLQGSSAHFFSGAHKRLANESDPDLADDSQAQDGLREWFQGDTDRPLRRPFDSHHTLGLDEDPSDYDIQISSDAMVEMSREKWEDNVMPGEFIHRKYRFVDLDAVAVTFEHLTTWADEQSSKLEREVVPALFASAGPPNKLPDVSAHFRDTDWKIEKETK